MFHKAFKNYLQQATTNLVVNNTGFIIVLEDGSVTWVSVNCNHDVNRAGSVAGRGTSCLTLRNELSEETHVLTKQEILLRKGTRVENSRVREPRTDLPRG